MGNKQKYVDSNGAWTAKDVIKEKGMWIDNPNIKDDWPISESRISELIDETSVKWGRYVRYVMPNGLLKGGSTHSAVMRRVVDGKPIMRTKPAPYVEGLPSKTLLEFGKKNPEAPPWIVGIPRDHEILGMWKLFSAADDMIHKIEFLCDGHVVSSRESATDFGAGADEVIEIVDQRTVNIHTNGGARTYSVSPDDFLLDSKGVKIGARYVWPK